MINTADHKRNEFNTKTIREKIKKIFLVGSVVLLLGGCATTGTSVHGISGSQVTSAARYSKPQSHDYQGRPTAVTPYEFKYKRVRDYLKTAYNIKEGETI